MAEQKVEFYIDPDQEPPCDVTPIGPMGFIVNMVGGNWMQYVDYETARAAALKMAMLNPGEKVRVLQIVVELEGQYKPSVKIGVAPMNRVLHKKPVHENTGIG